MGRVINTSFSTMLNDEFWYLSTNYGHQRIWGARGDAAQLADEGAPYWVQITCGHARRGVCARRAIAKTTSPTLTTRQEVGETKRTRLYGEGTQPTGGGTQPTSLEKYFLMTT